jgi:hypothetical protein
MGALSFEKPSEAVPDADDVLHAVLLQGQHQLPNDVVQAGAQAPARDDGGLDRARVVADHRAGPRAGRPLSVPPLGSDLARERVLGVGEGAGGGVHALERLVAQGVEQHAVVVGDELLAEAVAVLLAALGEGGGERG